MWLLLCSCGVLVGYSLVLVCGLFLVMVWVSLFAISEGSPLSLQWAEAFFLVVVGGLIYNCCRVTNL